MDKLPVTEPSVESAALASLAHSIEYSLEQSNNYMLHYFLI